MEIVYDDATLEAYIARATDVSPEHPVLVDRFLEDAVEIDVDALYDGSDLYLGGVMEHIEEAGIHSGDSACALPPITLGSHDIKRIRAATEAIAAGADLVWLIADDGDWPKELYRRMGFRPVTRPWQFTLPEA
jgi:carbamoyl-phosphate synthase large subunit